MLEKWLSYREKRVLGRGLTATEARAFTAIAWHLAALILLGPKPDRNLESVSSQVSSWPPKSLG